MNEQLLNDVTSFFTVGFGFGVTLYFLGYVVRLLEYFLQQELNVMFKRITKNVSNRVLGVSVALASVLCTAAAFAETAAASVTPAEFGVDASSISSSLTTSIKPWILGGLGIAIGVFVVKVGWRWIKQFAR